MSYDVDLFDHSDILLPKVGVRCQVKIKDTRRLTTSPRLSGSGYTLFMI